MKALDVLFLGTGDAFSAGGRNQSCCLIRGTTTSVLLDCGATTLAALKRAGRRSGEIDTILISHFTDKHGSGELLFPHHARPCSSVGHCLPPGIVKL